MKACISYVKSRIFTDWFPVDIFARDLFGACMAPTKHDHAYISTAQNCGLVKINNTVESYNDRFD